MSGRGDKRVFLVVLGTHGDVLPFIALGVTLKARGYVVSLAAPASFSALAARAGLSFTPIGTKADFDRVLGTPWLWRPIRGARLLFLAATAAAEPVYRWLEAHCRPGNDVVVASALAFGARIAQDRLGLSLATLHLMPMLVESRHAPPRLPGLPLPDALPVGLRHWFGRGADKVVIGPAALPRLNAFRASLSLPPIKRLRHWWHSPQRVLLAVPGWYAPPQPDWPVQLAQTGFPLADIHGDTDQLPPGLNSFLIAGAPPLAFTYGSAMVRANQFFATAVAVCRRLRRRGVLLAPHGEQIPANLPADIHHTPYAPLSRLLPACAALIHHGGIGTVAQALAAGCPQLVVPLAFDHADEGRRVRRLGAGTTLSHRQFTPARASRVIGKLLASDAVASACSEVRARMAQEDGIATACDAIERMFADHGGAA